tara:strand:- start:204 stop:398 length:195 start_codon:yes stop_codon:yes gene_type:complete
MNENDLRDCFAMFAMMGAVMMNKEPYDDMAVAELSYNLADAMLEARKPQEEAGITAIRKRKVKK